MTTQCTTDGAKSGSHSYSREAAEPFAIRKQRAIFQSYPPAEQARIRADVIARLRSEARGREFQARDEKGKQGGSALARLAGPVYGVRPEDL